MNGEGGCYTAMAIDEKWLCGDKIFTPTCDICGETLDEEYEFYDAVEAKKLAGWRSKKIHGAWYDLCPDCQEKENHESAVGDFAGIGRL